MTRIPCRGGRFVECLDDDHWKAPAWRGTVAQTFTMDLTRIPGSVRPWWRRVLREAFQVDSVAQVRGIWHTALWFCRFHAATTRPLSTTWDEWTAPDWGAYAEWLKDQIGFENRPLSHEYRRGQFLWLAAAARHAIDVGLPGTSEVTVARIQSVSRRAFRGTGTLSNQRIQRRALTREQWDELDTILADEWRAFIEGEDDSTQGFLPVVVATWLAFHHGLRSAEINRITVDDVLPDPKTERHHLRVNAPNKEPDRIPIGRDTLTMLEALVSAGEESRKMLQTRLLFVSMGTEPEILTTSSTPWNRTGLTDGLRALLEKRQATNLPPDLKFPDGRLTLGTHLAYDIANRERVRQIMRHENAATTERYYRVPDKLRVARDIAAAIRSEAVRLTIACQQPIVTLDERPAHREVLARNPANAQLEYGSCGLDVARQGTCRMAVHCFECPLLVPWVSKRHNFVYERDVYEKKPLKRRMSATARIFSVMRPWLRPTSC